ncbi:MAG: LacI family transcriptional regulator [Lachnospiraceae bacterium]|nr:LacI family transcriptional regulator [Lachnospiraceae bacterium]
MKNIYEIAKMAGVSKSTVSRVLNNNGYVSQEVRDKVNKVVEETGYTPSVVARSLSRQETNIIGVVIPEMANHFFAEVLSGISEVCDQMGWSMICCDTGNDVVKEDRALRVLAQQRVRGLILTPAAERNLKERRVLETLFDDLEVPIVLLDRHLNKSRWGGVFYENKKSGYLATKELIQAGSETVGIITGDLKLQIARERYQGFLMAMEEAGKPIDEAYVFVGDFSVETSYKLTKKMIAAGNMPDSIITSNNLTSLGFLKAMREEKKRIGRDIAVIGIDSIDILDILDYSFSCVARDTNEMGKTAMRLLQELTDKKAVDNVVYTVPCVLQLKGSERRSP